MKTKRHLLFVTLSLVASLSGCFGDPELELGESIYASACKVCHAQGINGAPVYGNKKNWAPRQTQGFETLLEHATNGYGLMPAKGGRTELTDEEVGAAIKFMLKAVEG